MIIRVNVVVIKGSSFSRKHAVLSIDNRTGSYGMLRESMRSILLRYQVATMSMEQIKLKHEFKPTPIYIADICYVAYSGKRRRRRG